MCISPFQIWNFSLNHVSLKLLEWCCDESEISISTMLHAKYFNFNNFKFQYPQWYQNITIVIIGRDVVLNLKFKFPQYLIPKRIILQLDVIWNFCLTNLTLYIDQIEISDASMFYVLNFFEKKMKIWKSINVHGCGMFVSMDWNDNFNLWWNISVLYGESEMQAQFHGYFVKSIWMTNHENVNNIFKFKQYF